MFSFGFIIILQAQEGVEGIMKGSNIKQVFAREVFSERGHPAVEATVVTENNAVGVAVCTAGLSIGTHEIPFAYDGGDRWEGKGVMRAVNSVVERIAPAIIGLDAANQQSVDQAMLDIGKDVLGGNATAAVSAAVLKAGAKALDIPLYRHIGGARAVTLPVPGLGFLNGSTRYGGGERAGGKPTYEFTAYDFSSFSEAAYALWEIGRAWNRAVQAKFGVYVMNGFASLPVGAVNSDEEIWKLATEIIVQCGYEGKVGLQVDIASDSFVNHDTGLFEGLFDSVPRDGEALMAKIIDMIQNYPFVIVEDPLSEEDYLGHAELTRKVDIQIVGDDLFTTNPSRVAEGIKLGAANTVLLKVNQIGTISEAFDMVQLAYENGYGVMPCASRGEGVDIVDYCVGLNAGTVRGSGINAPGNRFIQIENELGARARFAGKNGLKGARFALK